MKHCLLLPVVMFLVAATLTSAQMPQPHDRINHHKPITDPAILAIIAARAARQQESADLLREARGALKRGDFPSAFPLLQQALSLDPDDGETRLMLSFFYVQKGQPDNVIAMLKPIIYPLDNNPDSVGNEISTRMIYTLALLDRNAWRDAVASYDKAWHPDPSTLLPGHSPSHVWDLPGGGPVHPWPDPQFSADKVDYSGLRAQAHLVLGSTLPGFMEEKYQFPYMLQHLRQVLLINTTSLDANFISGWLLGKMERFDDARVAYASAEQLGSPAVQKEINVELSKLKFKEDGLKRYQAQQAAMAAKAK